MINDEYCWMHTEMAYSGGWICYACNLVEFFECLALWARAVEDLNEEEEITAA